MTHAYPDWANTGSRHVWLPYAQMKTAMPPLPVVRSDGSRLTLADGRTLVDGIASWWTACHGYNHPLIAQAVREQLDTMPHIMLGGLTHEPANRLATRLADLLGAGLEHVFYSDSGSVAVEVAMKMAQQYWRNQGETKRTRFLAFRGAYHGDTFGTMAICDPEDGMHHLFRGTLTQHLIAPLPRDAATLDQLETLLAAHAHELAGIIVEPLIQGAGGMLMHPPQVLRHLRDLANRHGLLLIFDEIFTGFGRTGTLFAFEQTGIKPDIITLGKALTGGTLPLAATVASKEVFQAFWSDDPTHALMHGPTFMGNALACAAANASLDLFANEPRLAQVAQLAQALEKGLAPCREFPWVRDVRVLGAIGVVEIGVPFNRAALITRLVEAGVWVRPFGNVVYLTPAFTINEEDLNFLLDAVVRAIARGMP